MESGNAIVGAIAITLFVLPLLLLYTGRKKREKRFVGFLSNMAAQNGCKIDQHEIFGSFAIGFDEAKNAAFYYKQLKNSVEELFVDLKEIQGCRVENTSNSFARSGENQKTIERLELSFINRAKNKPAITMAFFNADENGQLSGELQSIEKWSKLFNDQLKAKK